MQTNPNLFKELEARGMIYQSSQGTADFLQNTPTKLYLGIDPTADSLHIGHLVPLLLLIHLQKAGHQPILVVGGATGRIGDPSGRSEERNLLEISTLKKNILALRTQLAKLLDFTGDKPAIMVDNFDWFENISFLNFARDIGKHITVNYMLNKESVSKRISSEQGISFTEFTYQLIQGYDFLHLFQAYGCAVQIGGADQWGNMLTGIELIRRKSAKEAFVITTPLITHSNGEKFGKTAQGAIWLDPNKTSPFTFYQFWINVSDEEAARFIKIFTFLDLTQIEILINEHKLRPNERLLQKQLAFEVTKLVHGETQANFCTEYSQALFHGQNLDFLNQLEEAEINNIVSALPCQELSCDLPISLLDLLIESKLSTSKSEARRQIQSNSIAVNKHKISNIEHPIELDDFFQKKYLILQVGKKNFHLIKKNN